MTSGDLESRSRSTIYELDLYLGVRYLHTKAEVPSLIICGDIIRKPSVDGRHYEDNTPSVKEVRPRGKNGCHPLFWHYA
jgi:hypothetical protein